MGSTLTPMNAVAALCAAGWLEDEPVGRIATAATVTMAAARCLVVGVVMRGYYNGVREEGGAGPTEQWPTVAHAFGPLGRARRDGTGWRKQKCTWAPSS